MISAFAGHIASGKSAVSKAIAMHYSVQRVSFGDTVRAEANRRGLENVRSVLQDLGNELIAAGWDLFCSLVVGQVDWDGHSSLVVDGVRHPSAAEALRRLTFPSRMYLVFIDTTWERRSSWLEQRGIFGDDANAAAHPNEAELEEVYRIADLVVQNNAGLDETVARIVGALDQLGGL